MHESIWRLFFRENVTKIPENASLQWDPHSKVTSPGGERGGNKKNLARNYFFFEHETKTKKNVRSFLSIGSSRYVAQFLDHLEHSGYAILRGEKKSANIFRYETKLYNGNPYSKLPGAAGIGESI